jgi:glycosyltransferase involved in cell wall biosynthesis
MTVLHILPTFDSGGLGSLGLQMIRAWPEHTRHIVMAPRYRSTKPVLWNDYEKLVGRGNLAQVPREAIAQPTFYMNAFAQQLRRMQGGTPVKYVINYNFSDAVWNVQAVRQAKFEGNFLVHVGTVLDSTRKDVQLAATSKFHWKSTFVPASSAARQALLAAQGAREQTGIHFPLVAAVVWNGVDHSKFVQRPFGYRPAPLRIGFTGRMAHPAVKNWKLLIASFRNFITRGGQGELRIAGDGPMRAYLEADARNLPVKFVGLLPPEEIPKFLSEIDVFFMAALPIEGFSMALVEAIAARCMIVGSNVPSVRELLWGQADFSTGNGVAALPVVESSIEGGLALHGLHRPDVQLENQKAVARLADLLDARVMAARYKALGDE